MPGWRWLGDLPGGPCLLSEQVGVPLRAPHPIHPGTPWALLPTHWAGLGEGGVLHCFCNHGVTDGLCGGYVSRLGVLSFKVVGPCGGYHLSGCTFKDRIFLQSQLERKKLWVWMKILGKLRSRGALA